MPEYEVFSRQMLEGTIGDLPGYMFKAWFAIVFEAKRLKGRVKIPIRVLAGWARITNEQAKESLTTFLAPDEFSSSREHEGRRLVPLPEFGDDWFQVVTWEKHEAERKAYFARLRVQRHRENKGKNEDRVTLGNAVKRSVTKELEQELELEPYGGPNGPPPREREISTTARGRAKTGGRRGRKTPAVSAEVEAALRNKVRLIRGDVKMMEMLIADPDSFDDACRDATGYNANELADITGDDAIRPRAKKRERKGKK